METPQTWDVDGLSPTERLFLKTLMLGGRVAAVFLTQREYLAGEYGWAARGLSKLGILEIEGDGDDEVAVSFTSDGKRWLASLPEGAL